MGKKGLILTCLIIAFIAIGMVMTTPVSVGSAQVGVATPTMAPYPYPTPIDPYPAATPEPVSKVPYYQILFPFLAR